ncbi:DUF2855 family protein [Sphingosinicellaceae bacterium]|nr:DUF2855 family protein [Sphingosinicellaceae bacterium]
MIIEVSRDDLRVTRAVERPAEPGPGQAAFAVERFALTSNNVTYAAHGVDMRYWDFFSAPGEWGVVPVWGFGRVTASNVEGLEIGERFYGYWPMADAVVLTPVKVTRRGFVDGAAHRSELAAVYNGYGRATDLPGDEALHMLFRPLYVTSFLLDLACGDGGTAVLSSASSKTAMGLAHALKARGGWTVIGLTSERNLGFVEATGLYDSVALYDEVDGLKVAGRNVYVDFAGDGAVRAAVHNRFADALASSIVVGDTHWEVSGAGQPLPGPRPEFFFAPTIMAERLAEWGQAGFDERLAVGWQGFTAAVAPWLRVVAVEGVEAARASWTRMASGDVDPAEGLVVRV